MTCEICHEVDAAIKCHLCGRWKCWACRGKFNLLNPCELVKHDPIRNVKSDGQVEKPA